MKTENKALRWALMLMCSWLTPVWVMLAAGELHGNWSYIKSALIVWAIQSVGASVVALGRLAAKDVEVAEGL